MKRLFIFLILLALTPAQAFAAAYSYGPTPPAHPSFDTMWIDPNTSPNNVNFWDGTTWVIMGTIDPINHVYTPNSSFPFIGLPTIGSLLIGNGATFVTHPMTGDAALTAGGVLTTTGLQGRPVAVTAPTTNQVLGWTGSVWAPVVPPSGGISGLTSDVTASGVGSVPATVRGLQGRPVSATAPATNQVLTWNGSTWLPVTGAAGGGGITQLTTDVLSGPGSGSQTATVVGLRGNPLGSAAPNPSDVLSWNGTQWVPVPVTGGSGGGVGPGSANNLAYYQNAGTAVAALPTVNNGILITSGTGVPSISSTAPSSIVMPSPVLQGTVTGTYTLAGTPSIAATALTGTLQAAQEPAHTGAVTNTAGSLVMSLSAGAASANIGTLSGVLTGTLPSPGLQAGAASNNVGVLGGALGGTLPNPSLAAGAASTNIGTLGGSLSGTLPNPSLSPGAAANNVGTLGGDLSGNLPNPTILKINGVAFGINPAVNTVPVVTSANTTTYVALPAAAMALGSAATNVGSLGGALGGTLPNPSLAFGAAAANIGSLGGALSGTLPNPNMAAGAAAANIGSLGGVLVGSLPNPTLASGAAAANIGTLGGVLSGTLPNPTMVAGAAATNVGTLGGDLSGTTLPNPIVTGIQGRPVASTLPTNGQVLTWNGTSWVPVTNSTGGITQLTSDVTTPIGSGVQPATVIAIQGNPVTTTLPTTDQALEWNGSAWAPADVAPKTAITQLSGAVTTPVGPGPVVASIAPTGVTLGNYTVSDGAGGFLCIAVASSGQIISITNASCTGGTHFLLLAGGVGNITLNGGGSLLTNGS